MDEAVELDEDFQGLSPVLEGAGRSQHVTTLSNDTVGCVVIDEKQGGYEHDWRLPRVNAALCKFVSTGMVKRIIHLLDVAEIEE